MHPTRWLGLGVAAALSIAVVLVVWPGGAAPGQVDDDGRLEIVMEDYEFEVDE